MSKLKEQLKAKRIKQKELGKMVGYDESEMSKIVGNRVLPTPQKMTAICKALDCEVLEIYDRLEIDLLPKVPSREKVRNSRGYNLCVFIPEAYRYILPEALSAAGHKTFYDWLKPYIEQTVSEYQEKRRREKQ